MINKIKKLRLKYKAEKDKSRKSGNGAGRKWKFFDSLDRFLATRPSVTPLAVYDSSALVEKADNDTEVNNVTETNYGN